jgi:hypothetical protein
VYVIVIKIGKGLIDYETNRRKVQAKSKILADQLPAGKRTRPRVNGHVYGGDPGVYVVGKHNRITRKSK